MEDLTKIDRPFGELDQETQWALRGAWEAGETIQYRRPCTNSIYNFKKDGGGRLGWVANSIYRIKPKPEVVEKTFTMYVIGGPTMEPAMVNGPVDVSEGWIPVTVKVQWVDGKITDYLTELAQ